MKDILLVEDHQELNDLMRAFLEKAGFSVHGVLCGEDALEYFEKEKTKMIVLDVSLQGMDGFEVCTKIRTTSKVPILFLSARVDKEAKMSGYMSGADDYIEKPVDLDIFLAKVQALMHRNYDWKEESEIVKAGSLVIDKSSQKVFVEGREVLFNAKEYELLLLLASHPGVVLRKEFLFQEIWGADSFSENQTLTVHIKRLRDKIEKDPKHPKKILTIWGVGYKYETEE